MASMSADKPMDDDAATRALPDRRARRQHHLLILVAVIVVLVLAFALEVRSPTQVGIRGIEGVLPPSCRFRTWTGLDCPSCGLTRAFISIAHGDLSAALAFNPVSPLVFAAFLFQVPYRAAQIRRLDQAREELKWPWITRALWMLLGLGLAQWILRLAMG